MAAEQLALAFLKFGRKPPVQRVDEGASPRSGKDAGFIELGVAKGVGGGRELFRLRLFLITDQTPGVSQLIIYIAVGVGGFAAQPRIAAGFDLLQHRYDSLVLLRRFLQSALLLPKAGHDVVETSGEIA